MTRLRALGRIATKPMVILVKLLAGIPLNTPSFGSMTLDMDDVRLARKWLKRPADWFDAATVCRYESEFARWNGSKWAFASMGGRVALSACIHALDLQPGDEVILPGYTCVVVPNAFHYAGVNAVFSDIETDTYGLDVNQIESKITSRTRAILLHHLYGLVCRDYDAILHLAKRHGLSVIEDCAHATGATYKGIHVGNGGDIAFYSTEQSKVLNTIQGGMVVTNDGALAERLKEYFDKASYPDEEWIRRQLYNVILNFHLYKSPRRWWSADIARLLYGRHLLNSTTAEECEGVKPVHYGRKMPAPIAELGLNQLRKLDQYNQLRRKNAERWDRWCEANGYARPLVIQDSQPVFLRYPVLVAPEKKKDTRWAMRELGVELGIWFVSNVHPAKRHVSNCPQADMAVRCCINFPTLLG